MKRLTLGALSAVAISGALVPALVPALTPVARAQGFTPNAPFVANAGIIGPRGTRHFIEVSVAAFPVTGVTVECTNLGGVDRVDVTDQFGNRIGADFDVKRGSEGGTALLVSFNEQVNPGTTLRLVMNGVERQLDGGAMFYRVSAQTENIPYPFPVGTARLTESPVGDR